MNMESTVTVPAVLKLLMCSLGKHTPRVVELSSLLPSIRPSYGFSA